MHDARAVRLPCAAPQACSRTPADVARDGALKEQLQAKAQRIKVSTAAPGGALARTHTHVRPGQASKPVASLTGHVQAWHVHARTLAQTLEHEVEVLRAKLATDSKVQRQTLAGAKREQESLKRQVRTETEKERKRTPAGVVEEAGQGAFRPDKLSGARRALTSR